MDYALGDVLGFGLCRSSFLYVPPRPLRAALREWHRLLAKVPSM